MKVVVTGGTGFVGRALVRQLRDAGHSVRCLARRSQPALPGVEFVRASVLEFATLPSAFARADAVIHLVGIIAEVGDQTFERVHTLGTANAIHAARAAGIRRFVHMSALGTRPNAVSRYHRSKWEAEGMVRRSGLQWTILRPSLIYGPGDGFVNRFWQMTRYSPVLPIIGPGNALLQPIAVEEVARCFTRALVEPEAVGQTFDLCGPRAYSLRDVMVRILEASGNRRGLVHLPVPLATVAARFLELVFPRLLGQAPPLNQDQIVMLQEDNVGDPRPAERCLGLQAVEFETGLRRMRAADGRAVPAPEPEAASHGSAPSAAPSPVGGSSGLSSPLR